MKESKLWLEKHELLQKDFHFCTPLDYLIDYDHLEDHDAAEKQLKLQRLETNNSDIEDTKEYQELRNGQLDTEIDVILEKVFDETSIEHQ